jgi:pre-mRNA-splicing factor CWC22
MSADVQALKRKRYFQTYKMFLMVLIYPFHIQRSPSDSNNDGNVAPTNRIRSHSPTTRVEQSRGDDVDAAKPADPGSHPGVPVVSMELEKADKPKAARSAAQTEFDKLLGSRSGGIYMPPARLRALQQAAANDKTSPEYQRLSWDALRKSITGIVNRVNITNIKQVVPELFEENLIRGRGLFSRSIMKAQAASLPFTPVFSALVAIINTKLPQVGELLLTRLISQFRRAFKRNDKVRLSVSLFLIGG